MTLDREIRVTPDQIHYLDRLVRRRVSELTVKIERAETNRRAGQTIQRGTLDAHHKEREALVQFRTALDVALRQIQHQIMAKVGLDPEGRNE